jgi:glycosyltransferase involved in cell wall biosynthesis
MTSTAKPMVVIHSLFRDRQKYLSQYQQQIESLDWPRSKLKIVCTEGDSLDGTGKWLDGWAGENSQVHVVHQSLGYPKFGSVIDPVRIEMLSRATNFGLDYIAGSSFKADYVMFLESDLIFEPDLIMRLVAHGKHVVAPMIWVNLGSGDIFYDTWAFRDMAGNHFGWNDRKWYEHSRPMELYQVTSVGSCVLANAQLIYDGVRLPEDGAIAGFCDEVRKRRKTIWVDPTTHVRHPWPR